MSLDVCLWEYCQHCNRWEEYYSRNITHNLNTMAKKAWIYEHLWRPDEINIKKASELIKPLEAWLKKLKAKPEYYKKFNASNWRWLYEHFVEFVDDYLEACKKYPDMDVWVSR